MTDEQKECCHALVGLALKEQEGGDNDDGEEDDTVKQNVFDKDTNATVLKHSIEESQQCGQDRKEPRHHEGCL